jgi:hypothetical protein
MPVYPERDDVLIVRRHVETPARTIAEAWDVQTVLGETLSVHCSTRDDAERDARRIAQHRQVSVFYEDDPRRADSVLEFVVSYRVSDAAPVA